MKFPWILFGVALPVAVVALSYETDTLPYSDVPSDRATQVAISTLTELGIVRGHPDGTFKPGVPINRAEFMKIAMGLLPPLENTQERISVRCFPDVDPNIWFAAPVCRAKFYGIVRGNATPGVDPNLWKFEPTRAVKYEEALKILSGIYNVPLINISGEWYEKYVQTAYKVGIDLKDSAPGSSLTRGQMARLVVAFMAHVRDELDELRAAESYSSMSVRTVFSAPPLTSSTSSVSSASSSDAIYDDLLYDTSTDDAVLILGKVTHILGAAKIFSNAEPILVDKFIIDLVSANDSLEAMNVYDDRGKLLGRATRDGAVSANTRYRLSVKNSNIIIPKREEFTFYVRGVLRPQDQGGTSGGSIQVDQMGIEGTGYWSSNDYEQFTSGETYAATTVARSAITSITNAGDSTATLIEGSDIEVGAFRFEGTTGHSAARIDVTAINFQIGVSGGVTLSNATMKADGSSDRHTCSIAGSTLTCSSLPPTFGRLDDSSRTLRIYADVDIPDASTNASLQLSINNPGTASSAGDISWSDGVTTFTWIDLGTKPVARGTYYAR